jgi:hypothetical protein
MKTAMKQAIGRAIAGNPDTKITVKPDCLEISMALPKNRQPLVGYGDTLNPDDLFEYKFIGPKDPATGQEPQWEGPFYYSHTSSYNDGKNITMHCGLLHSEGCAPMSCNIFQDGKKMRLVRKIAKLTPEMVDRVMLKEILSHCITKRDKARAPLMLADHKKLLKYVESWGNLGYREYFLELYVKLQNIKIKAIADNIS